MSMKPLTGGEAGDDYKVAALKPISDPLELRDVTVKDYLRTGVDYETARRSAQCHLEFVEAYQRGQDKSPRPAPSAPKPPQRAEAATAEPDAGVKMANPSGQRVRASILNTAAHRHSPKWSAAVARIKRITAGFRPVFLPNGECDIKASIGTCEAPALAERYWRLYQNFKLWCRASRHNPFITAAGNTMSLADASRKFEAEVYAICDASTGIPGLGSWYTR